MAPNNDPLACKETFLQEHQLFSEIEFTNESKPIGKLDSFDLVENEIWLLQCPKDMNITEVQNQKLKVPGRSNINSSEAVSMEFDESNERHAFAYYKKGRYVLRLLPVRGTIVLRDRLQAAETVTEERAQQCVSPAKRVPMPKSIRLRHPLLGINYEDKVKLDKSIEERLQNADKKAAQILKERLNQRSGIKLAVGFKKIVDQGEKISSPIKINSDDDVDTVEFVSEEKLKKKRKKSKRKQGEGNKLTTNSEETPKTEKLKKLIVNEKEFVSKDLQWLQTI